MSQRISLTLSNRHIKIFRWLSNPAHKSLEYDGIAPPRDYTDTEVQGMVKELARKVLSELDKPYKVPWSLRFYRALEALKGETTA